MAEQFLTDLSDALSDQFSLGENSNHTLDIAVDGSSQRYGKLGDFAKKFDQSQERRYLQEGYLRTDPYNVSPKQMEILLQEPDITVLVKKRAFSTLSENYRLDHLDTDEKLFYKATKILFQNKCQQIATLEKLSKIARVTTETGEVAKQLFPLVLSLVDEIGNTINGSFDTSTENDILNGTFTAGFGKLQSVVNQIRKVYNYTANNTYTTWLQDTTNPFKTKLGQGSGVIEFTNVTSINTNCHLLIDSAPASFNISDPYNMMLITSTDIERALSDATNKIYNHKIFQFAQQSSDDFASALIKELNGKRARRGASAIQFIINADTIFGKRVRAIIEKSGIEINFTYNPALGLGSLISGGGTNISEESFRGGPEVGEEGIDRESSSSIITSSEASVFSRVVENIFNGLQLNKNSQSLTTKQNAAITNYARRKLRTHYLGKLVIQPLDQVHVYISSKSRTDNKILGGLKGMFTGLGFLQNMNNISTGLKDQWSSLFNPSDNASFQLEKSAIVGSDFPNWLWTILRSQFVNDTGGAHVYGGIVENPRSSFRNGINSVSVSVKSNTEYLNFGKVNFKPALDVFNGPFYDPLTPFETSFDTVSGNFKKEAPKLLKENVELLKQGVIKYKAGPNVNKIVTEENFFKNQDKEEQEFGSPRNVYYCPDGFTYRWKEGIGTLVQFSESLGASNTGSTGHPPLTKDPFAGQDVMNVISLAITGIPYNFATFYKASREINGYSRNVQSGADSANSFYQALNRDLAKNNTLWGNFIPFKNLVMDEDAFARVLTSQNSVTNINDQINQKLVEIQDITRKLHLLQRNQTIRPAETTAQTLLTSTIAGKQSELNSLYSQSAEQLKTSSAAGLYLAGDDVSFDTDEFINNNKKNNESLTKPSIRKELRRKLNFLTRRLSWQVRANEDKNFLIIDDSYDRDYDLLAYEKDLSEQMQAFNSDYANVLSKVRDTSKLLDLEVFCDTQGHIRVRPPQYNRMPSSVFYRLFQLKQSTGIQIFPQFLEDLFVNQIESLISQIEIIEDQIRLAAATLGKSTDSDVLILVDSPLFKFISDESNGKVNEFGWMLSVNPENAINNQSLTFQQALDQQAGVKQTFNTITKSQFLTNFISQSAPGTITSSDRINRVIERLHNKTGQQVTVDNFLTKNNEGFTELSGSPSRVVDAFKVTNDISNSISQRQRLVKHAANALKNAKEYLSLNNNNDSDTFTANKLLMPDISRNSNIPEVFANMIEDETYDDYGPGSGSRYIIKEYQIIDLNIEEHIPEFTAVEVKGQFNDFATPLPTALNNNITGSGGGNALITAAAIDYDLWRIYGMRNTKTFAAPFLSKPITQCAPYAAMILSRQRKDIFRGSLTIAGNEFMQPGDVIYLESRDMLFYVDSVSHNFSYGGSFQTTLQLSYGHPPGDYIPTTLDMIGKLIYNNKEASDFVNYRQNSANNNEKSLGTIILDTRKSQGGSDKIEDNLLGGTFGNQNVSVISEILNTTVEALSINKDLSNNTVATIELRIFNSAGTPDETINTAASIVKGLLSQGKDDSDKKSVFDTEITIDSDDIEIVSVNVFSDKDYRSPSQKAIDMVKNVQDLIASKDFKQTLFTCIIDCWIVFSENNG